MTTSSTYHLLGTSKKCTSTGQAFRVRKQLDGVQHQQLAKAAAAELLYTTQLQHDSLFIYYYHIGVGVGQ